MKIGMNRVVGKLGEMNIRWVTSKIHSLKTLFADMNFVLQFLMTGVTLISKLAFAHNLHLQFVSNVTTHSGYRRWVTVEGSGGIEEARRVKDDSLTPGLGSWVIMMSLRQVNNRVR